MLLHLLCRNLCRLLKNLKFSTKVATKAIQWQAEALLDPATKSQECQNGTEREPSSARSGYQRERTPKPIPCGLRDRTRCEPRTARAPVEVSRCTCQIA